VATSVFKIYDKENQKEAFMAIEATRTQQPPPQQEVTEKPHHAHGGGAKAADDDPNDPNSPNYQGPPLAQNSPTSQAPYDQDGKGPQAIGKLGDLEQGTTGKA
jgi:hypothetical protein